MACLGCELITFAPVTLDDGRTVCNTCDDYRHECEVREVAGWETNERRKKYLEGVEQVRGAEAAKRLRVDVWNLIKKQEASK